VQKDEKPRSDQHRASEVEREERADDPHRVDVDGEVLLEVDGADDEHRDHAERPQRRGRGALARTPGVREDGHLRTHSEPPSEDSLDLLRARGEVGSPETLIGEVVGARALPV
jgi:hypothetical protein